MAKERWRLKNALIAERDGFGTIMVAGKDILQFDKDWKFVMKRSLPNAFQAIQQWSFMMGPAIMGDLDTNETPATKTEDS